MKNIFIAGAGGYIGTRLTKHLLDNKYKVVALDRFFFGDTLFNLESHKNLSIIKGDIRYFDKKYLKDIDVVINLAALSNDSSSDLKPKITKQINYLGAKRIARLAKQMNVPKYIFASSCSVYGSGIGELNEMSKLYPISQYAKSKIQTEKALEKLSDKKFKVLIYRLSTLFGLSINRMKFDLMVNIMTLHAWKNNKIYILGGGQQWRPLLHISDAIEAFENGISLRNSENNSEVINIGSSNQNFQTIQVAYKFRKYFPNLEIEIAPDGPDPNNYKVNFDKARRLLKLEPKKTINDGILEIKGALEKGTIKDDIRTSTHSYYKYLLDADEVLKKVKIGKKLF